MSTKPVGIIAAEHAGGALATALVAQRRRVLWHSGSASCLAALPRGVERASTPTDIAFECDVVLTLIDDTAELRALLFGDADRSGIGIDLSAGAVVIDLGVRPPRETQALLGHLGMRGIAIIDAAIVGSPSSIQSGAAMVLAGGFPDAVDTATPVLGAFGRIERTGPLGSAHTAAALMGYMEAAHIVARDEAFTVGAALGLDGGALARVLDGAHGEASDAVNVITLSRRMGLARRLAAERGLSADIIDLTQKRFERQ